MFIFFIALETILVFSMVRHSFALIRDLWELTPSNISLWCKNLWTEGWGVHVVSGFTHKKWGHLLFLKLFPRDNDVNRGGSLWKGRGWRFYLLTWYTQQYFFVSAVLMSHLACSILALPMNVKFIFCYINLNQWSLVGL